MKVDVFCFQSPSSSSSSASPLGLMQSEDHMILLLFLLLFVHLVFVLGSRFFKILCSSSGNDEFYRKHSFTFKNSESRPSLSFPCSCKSEEESTTVAPQITGNSASNLRLSCLKSSTFLSQILADSIAHCSSTQTTTRRHSPQRPRIAVKNPLTWSLQACLVCTGPAPWVETGNVSVYRN